MPGVEHARGGPNTKILALAFLQDSRKDIKKVVIYHTRLLPAAGAACWATDTLHAGGLVRSSCKQNTAQMQIRIVLTGPGED